MKINCNNCGKEFNKRENQVKRSKNHACSRACAVQLRRGQKTSTPNIVACAACSKEIERKPSQMGKFSFCSSLCRTQFNYKEFIVKWMNNEVTGNKGKGGTSKYIRRFIIEKFEGKCGSCGVGSIWNNKPLTLQLDHIDGDCSNNTEENLRLLCPNCHTQTNNWGSKNDKPSARYYGNRYKEL